MAREKIESSGLFFIFELCPLARRMKRIRKPHFLFVSLDLEPKGFAFLPIHQLPSYCVLTTLSLLGSFPVLWSQLCL